MRIQVRYIETVEHLIELEVADNTDLEEDATIFDAIANEDEDRIGVYEESVTSRDLISIRKVNEGD